MENSKNQAEKLDELKREIRRGAEDMKNGRYETFDQKSLCRAFGEMKVRCREKFEGEGSS